MAKSMSAGFPLSAVVGKAELLDKVHVGGLGSTFGGNPVSCAVALAVIETIEKDRLCEQAVRIGNTVKERLTAIARQVKFIGDVRGLGAMIGVEIVKNGIEPDKDRTEKIVAECAKRGVLFLTAGVEGNIIRTLMPLCITDDQLDEALNVWEEAIKSS
jgi:4-aminobutyrate aminotransferase/(S)-3-amino-2-methylpropionate transaminase